MPTILGIDPGSNFTGYGVVSKEGNLLRLVNAGRIAARRRAAFSDRLHQVFHGLMEIVNTHSPDAVAVEDIFYAKNIRSAVRLGHVRGVALLAAAEAGLPVFEYPPTAIKMAVVGYGRADKSQVGLMVGQILKLDKTLPEDASDAVAAALCHINQIPYLAAADRSG